MKGLEIHVSATRQRRAETDATRQASILHAHPRRTPHKVYHARLAEKTGIPKENIFILDNGNILEVSEESVQLNGSVTSGRIYVDGKGVGDVEDMVLRDRRRLAHDGIVIVIMAIEKLTGNIVSGPDIISRGFIFEERRRSIK
jgi:mRNA degradation ribonuclease J1/J2